MTRYVGLQSGVFPGDTSNVEKQELLEIMRAAQGEMSDKDFAAVLRISPTYLSDVYRGRRDPGESVLRALGVERRVTYLVKERGLAGRALRASEKEKRS